MKNTIGVFSVICMLALTACKHKEEEATYSSYHIDRSPRSSSFPPPVKHRRIMDEKHFHFIDSSCNTMDLVAEKNDGFTIVLRNHKRCEYRLCPLALGCKVSSEPMIYYPKDGKYGASSWRFEVTEENPYANIMVQELDSTKRSKAPVVFTLQVRSLKDDY